MVEGKLSDGFMSFAGENYHIAERVAAVLKDEMAKLIHLPENDSLDLHLYHPPANRYDPDWTPTFSETNRQVFEALSQSAFMVVIMTPEFFDHHKDFCIAEIEYYSTYVCNDKSGGICTILPILIGFDDERHYSNFHGDAVKVYNKLKAWTKKEPQQGKWLIREQDIVWQKDTPEAEWRRQLEAKPWIAALAAQAAVALNSLRESNYNGHGKAWDQQMEWDEIAKRYHIVLDNTSPNAPPSPPQRPATQPQPPTFYPQAHPQIPIAQPQPPAFYPQAHPQIPIAQPLAIRRARPRPAIAFACVLALCAVVAGGVLLGRGNSKTAAGRTLQSTQAPTTSQGSTEPSPTEPSPTEPSPTEPSPAGHLGSFSPLTGLLPPSVHAEISRSIAGQDYNLDIPNPAGGSIPLDTRIPTIDGQSDTTYASALQVARPNNGGYNKNQIWHIGVCGDSGRVFIGSVGQSFTAADGGDTGYGYLTLVRASDGSNYAYIAESSDSDACNLPGNQKWILTPEGDSYAIWNEETRGCLTATSVGTSLPVESCGQSGQLWNLTGSASDS
ncbi:hypothetical protein [Frankia tisae]|uniref:hypothetical protein n=1 Tax=Frankia tisae TaxID=2950104 RepID=UPI0021C1CA85|nr:hypothetical protein [Frankia tisae]